MEVLSRYLAMLVDRCGQMAAGRFLFLFGRDPSRSAQQRITEIEAAEAVKLGRKPS